MLTVPPGICNMLLPGQPVQVFAVVGELVRGSVCRVNEFSLCFRRILCMAQLYVLCQRAPDYDCAVHSDFRAVVFLDRAMIDWGAYCGYGLKVSQSCSICKCIVQYHCFCVVCGLWYYTWYYTLPEALAAGDGFRWINVNLVDPASSYMLVSKIKPCMPQYKLQHGKAADGSLKQWLCIWVYFVHGYMWKI